MTEVPATPGACAGCISRRSFLADAATIAAVSALFAACDGDSPVEPPTGKVDVKVADFPGLATNNTLVLIDGKRAAKRTGTDTFVAWSRLCTHEGTPVNVDGNSFLCPNHLSRFDANGNVTIGPAAASLQALPASYDAATDTLTIG